MRREAVAQIAPAALGRREHVGRGILLVAGRDGLRPRSRLETSRPAQVDVRERDVPHRRSRTADDERRAAEAVRLDARDDDPLDRPRARCAVCLLPGPPGRDDEIERTLHVVDDEIPERDVARVPAVAQRDVDAALGALQIVLGIVHHDVAEGDVLEPAAALGADLHAVAPGANDAIGHGYVSHTRRIGQRRVGLEADAVVRHMQVAVRDGHMLRIHDVDAVGVDHVEMVHEDAPHRDVAAVVEHERPARRVVDPDAFHDDMAAAFEEQHLAGTPSFERPPLRRLLVHPRNDPVRRLPVDLAHAREADVLRVLRQQQMRLLGVVLQPRARPEARARLQMQPHAAAKPHRPDRVVAGRHEHRAAAGRVRRVDRRLDADRVQNRPRLRVADDRHRTRLVADPLHDGIRQRQLARLAGHPRRTIVSNVVHVDQSSSLSTDQEAGFSTRT